MVICKAEVIDHNVPFAEMPVQEANVEYVRHMLSITMCSLCQGADLKCGAPLEPGSQPGPDFTAKGSLSDISEQDFIALFRTHGIVESDHMAWDRFSRRV